MILRFSAFLIIGLSLVSCKKEEDQCAIYQHGYCADRNIPDSVSVDSMIVIGMLLQRKDNCEFFDSFWVDTLSGEPRTITMNTAIKNCGCIPDTTKFEWQYYSFKPDTVGDYPVLLSAYDGLGMYFGATIHVYWVIWASHLGFIQPSSFLTLSQHCQKQIKNDKTHRRLNSLFNFAK